MKLLSKDSVWNFWPTWVAIGIMTPIIIYLVMIDHDAIVTGDKAHTEWYNAWKNSITQLDSCQPFLTPMYEDEKDKWLHSELWPLIEKRYEELKC